MRGREGGGGGGNEEGSTKCNFGKAHPKTQRTLSDVLEAVGLLLVAF